MGAGARSLDTNRGSVLTRLSLRPGKGTMSRSPGQARVRAPLTELEHDVMRVVWTSGSCSVEAVHQVVSRTRDVKETTVRTLLRRLEQKGYLRHDVDGRAYIYHANE